MTENNSQVDNTSEKHNTQGHDQNNDNQETDNEINIEDLIDEIKNLQHQNQVLRQEIKSKEEIIIRKESDINTIQARYTQQLQNEIQQKNKEIEELISRYKDILNASKQGSKFDFAKDIRSTVNDLLNICKVDHKGNIDNLIQSIEMIIKSLIHTLKQNDIELILPAIGDKFDYKIHNAAAPLKTSISEQKNTICNVIKPGIKSTDDKLSVPADVVVWS